MNTDQFTRILDLHKKWSLGILFKEIQTLETAQVFTSDISTEYFNFAIPTVNSPEKLDLDLIKNYLNPKGEKTAINLFEIHQHAGFVEYLIKNNFKLESRDAWLLFNRNGYKKEGEALENIKKVGFNNFEDFCKVARGAFESFSGNEKYLEMEAKFLRGEIKSSSFDLKLKPYVLYENDKPVANGALFYSKQDDFGYLHDAGTLKEYRSKGYQSALIRHRVNECLDEGIKTIYVSAENGGSSWRNCIKNGFEQIQVIQTFIEK